MRILACAGAGKTSTMALRIKHLLEECGIEPSRIIVSTFNIEASNALRTRLTALLADASAVTDMLIGNIDKIAFRFCQLHLASASQQCLGVKEYCRAFLDFLRSGAPEGLALCSYYKYFFFDEF
jgi:superfamily I DNA/RNA helicase